MKRTLGNRICAALALGVAAVLAVRTLRRRKRTDTAPATPQGLPAASGVQGRGRLLLWLTVALYLVGAAVSTVLATQIRINYDVSDYLPADTQTAKGMELIEQEFGMTGSIQVMVPDVTPEQATAIQAQLGEIPYILTVNFDAADSRYYQDGTALFSMVIDGDDYSDAAKQVAADVRALFADRTDVSYGGTAIRKQLLQDTITTQMVRILSISLSIIAVILLVTSHSWLEPVLLLAASGIAILINRGTNLIFGEISYITSSVAAILQLALSIDYSIVLMHAYRTCRGEGLAPLSAMRRAVARVVRPVLASALTTIAGLFALLFMRFRIGYDTGTVLIKGIVISAAVSVTLLPALILLFEGAIEKTAKPAFVPRGRALATVAKRAGKAIVPVALAVVLICGALQTSNRYTFSDKRAGNDAISQQFGRNNMVVLIWQAGADDDARERALAQRLSALQKADGAPMLTGYTAYSNTVLANYGIPELKSSLGLSEADAKALLVLIALTKDPSAQAMTPEALLRFTERLLASDDADVAGLLSGTARTVAQELVALTLLLDQTQTAQELYAAIPQELASKMGLSLFVLQQLYGMFDYATVSDTAVDLRTMLEHLMVLTQAPDTAAWFSAETVDQLEQLQAGIRQAVTQMEQPTDREALRTYCKNQMRLNYSTAQIDRIFRDYFAAQGEEPAEEAPLLALLSYMEENRWISSPLKAALVRQYRSLYQQITAAYTDAEFLPALSAIVEGLTGEVPELTVSEGLVRQLYLSYYRTAGLLAEGRHSGWALAELALQEVQADADMAALLPQGTVDVLEDLLQVHTFLQEPQAYTYPVFSERLSDLLARLLALSGLEVPERAVWDSLLRGICVKYAAQNDAVTPAACTGLELVQFLKQNADTDLFLRTRLDADSRKRLDGAAALIEQARTLFRGDRYTRMLLAVDLPNEGEDSAAFVSAVTLAMEEVLGVEAYAVGEIVSTQDLQTTFAYDSRLISVVTLVAVFLIVLLLFRSLSLPILLVSVIQGAIFIAMATLRASSDGIFFMSYIVSVCLLMGATIDYGILMSSAYLNARRTQRRMAALRQAIAAALPTVFTSGSILAACGFVIFAISTQTAIAEVGLLLGVGAVSSVLMILLVLPSLLYLLDRFVLAFSLRRGGKRAR